MTSLVDEYREAHGVELICVVLPVLPMHARRDAILCKEIKHGVRTAGSTKPTRSGISSVERVSG